MNKSSKKILVTGVAGFLGSHLAEKLSNMGHYVVGVDNMTGGYKDNIPKKIKFYESDCCDLKSMNVAMKGVDVVYHCAATAHEGLSVFSPSNASSILLFLTRIGTLTPSSTTSNVWG